MGKDKPYTDPHLKQRARELHKQSPAPERILWGMLRARQLGGLKFRRQHPIGSYVVDFYCEQAALVVELDGLSHVNAGEKDQQRDAALRAEGLTVLRVTNDQVLQQPEAVKRAIAQGAGRAVE